MSNKYLRKTVARECPIHSDILDQCKALLVEVGYFEKKDVLEALNFTAVESSIRWDYIAQFISDEHDIDIVPLAQRFFSRHPIAERQTAPEKFIASGHGKKTVGYATVRLENGVFAIRQLKNKASRAKGMSKATEVSHTKLEAALGHSVKLGDTKALEAA